jgi:hypothetical protein
MSYLLLSNSMKVVKDIYICFHERVPEVVSELFSFYYYTQDAQKCMRRDI